MEHPVSRENWRTPIILLVLMSIAVPLAFNAWSALLNNFAVERAAFTGIEIGILQSLRECRLMASHRIRAADHPGADLRRLSLALLGLGVSLTGFFRLFTGWLFHDVDVVGFHYFEAVKQSLALQWFDQDEAPRVLAADLVGAVTSLVTYGALWTALEVLDLDYRWNFLIAGGACFGLAIGMWIAFPNFGVAVPQRKRIVLRKRYWLYYALTFLSGARRQIFIVFAAFLMVEKFGYRPAQGRCSSVNYAFTGYSRRDRAADPQICERAALTIEYAAGHRFHRLRVRHGPMSGGPLLATTVLRPVHA